VYFATAVAGATFFGAYAVLVVTALYLLSRREKTVTNIIMAILTVVMFGISATFFGLDMYMISEGLVNPKKYPGTVIDLFGPKTTTQIICQGINSILGDSIVIWRAWIVWGRRLSVVIVPLVLLVGVAFSSFGMAFAQVRALRDPSYATAFQKSMIALPSLTLATNLVATSLILSRVFALQYSMRKAERGHGRGSLIGHGGMRYHRLLKILIESGGMYCLTWLILLCLIVTGSDAAHVFLGIIGQLTGIYPTLIIVLVSLNMTQDRIQGPVVDTAIKFESNSVPMSTFARSISFTVAQTVGTGTNDTSDADADVEAGVAFVIGPGCEGGDSKGPKCESNPDVKEYVVQPVS